MRKPDASEGEIETALQGNLCRCTGYQPIIAAAQAAAAASPDADPLVAERGGGGWRGSTRSTTGGGWISRSDEDRVILPASVDDLAAVLEEVEKPTIVAGSTDVGLWITKFMREHRAGGLHRAPGRAARASR